MDIHLEYLWEGLAQAEFQDFRNIVDAAHGELGLERAVQPNDHVACHLVRSYSVAIEQARCFAHNLQKNLFYAGLIKPRVISCFNAPFQGLNVDIDLPNLWKILLEVMLQPRCLLVG